MNLPADTLADEVEPFLLREQYVIRTPRGRAATPRAYERLGRSARASRTAEPDLFDLSPMPPPEADTP
jgi:Holliday junction DNA helicase RuvB